MMDERHERFGAHEQNNGYGYVRQLAHFNTGTNRFPDIPMHIMTRITTTRTKLILLPLTTLAKNRNHNNRVAHCLQLLASERREPTAMALVAANSTAMISSI